MIDLKKYFKKDAMPGDIVTTTNFGLLPRIIYKKTWGKRKKSILRYSKRAHLGTHVAVVIKYQSRWYFIEMDATRTQQRYVSKVNNCILTPEEYARVKHAIEQDTVVYNIVSGCKITPWRKYDTDSIRAPHVCWIGRHPALEKSSELRDIINAWYINTYRYGVEYDFPDLFTFLKWNKKIGIVGSKNEYICSELPEAALQKVNIRTRDYDKPWSPMDWQCDKEMITIARM